MENLFFRHVSNSPPIREPIKHLHINGGDSGLDPATSIPNLLSDVGGEKAVKITRGVMEKSTSCEFESQDSTSCHL